MNRLFVHLSSSIYPSSPPHTYAHSVPIVGSQKGPTSHKSIISSTGSRLSRTHLVVFLVYTRCCFSSLTSAILGLTVLAIGNSVGDWVADTAVARAGKPGMGVASCFGSPLLNDVLGLSVALIVSWWGRGGGKKEGSEGGREVLQLPSRYIAMFMLS